MTDINDWLKAHGATKRDTLVTFGSTVKTTDDKGGIGGHVVLFGNPNEVDFYGEYFGPDTDYDLQPNQKSALYYQHGFDYHFKSQVLSRATLGVDEVGIWIEAQLDIHDDYMQALSDLIDEGIMGWSSGTAGHLVELEPRSKAWFIKRWPLGLDASITPSPADPRQVGTLRSLEREWAKEYEVFKRPKSRPLFFSFRQLWQARSPEAAAETPQSGVEDAAADVGTPANTSFATIEVTDNMPNNPAPEVQEHVTRSEFDALSAQMTELMTYIKSQPKLRSAGYVTDDGGEADRNVRSFGDYCLAVMRGDVKRLRSVYKSHQLSEVKTDLVEDSGNLGGWLVPEDFSLQLLQAAMKASSFLGIIPRTGVREPSGRWPTLNVFAAPTAGVGDTAEAAGLTSAVRAEGGAFTETNPSFEQVEWRVNDVAAGSIQVSKELRRDVAQIESLLMQLVAINDQAKQEYFVLRGNGVAQPLGVLNSGALVSVGPQTNSTFSWQDALDMVSRLFVLNDATVRWTFHPGVLPDIGVMEVGTAGGNTFVANMSAGLPMPLIGYPAGKSQHLPQDDNAGDVVLVDWSAYHIWDFGGSYMDFSEHVGFLNGLDTWRFGRYMDGKPLWRDDLTLADPQGSFTQTPFVAHND